MKSYLRFFLGSMACTVLLVSVNGCDVWLQKPAYGEVLQGEPLNLLVVQKPLTYRRWHQIESGFEYEILQQFAADSGYRLKIKTFLSEKEMLKQLKAGRGDLAAARFSELTPKTSVFIKSPVYDQEKTALVCRRSTSPGFSPEGRLNSEDRWKLVINPQSVESQWAEHFKHQAPKLKISRRMQATAFELLKTLNRGQADCTLVDRMEAHYHLRVFPALQVVKDISPALNYFFLIRPDRPELEEQMRKWMTRTAHRYVISQAKARAKGKASHLSFWDLRQFAKARESILPQYIQEIRRHSRDFSLPWQLTAAIAYQESRWNPEARSFTGVRGFMQLTEETAEHLGVQDREDPAQSIWGGVKYIRLLLDRQPKALPFSERLALALATYNVGPAHMWDAQKLAQRLGKNPYSWQELQKILPLLGDPEYLPYLKYGLARGQEPVNYVRRVFSYFELLSI